MTWTLPAQAHRVFERNPLVAVIVELRFFPILKVPAKVVDFQERVRARYPAFQEAHRQLINLGPAPVEVRADQVFTFAKADDTATLTLTTGSMSLESRRHEHRAQLFDDVQVGLDALLAVYGPIATTRLGLRYVNIVDREQVADGLGRQPSWGDLITNRFHAVPAGLAAPNDTLFACEVASPVAGGGAQTARYGLIKDADARVKFRLDVDRYVEGSVDPNVVVSSLNAFADDVFAVFIAAAGPDLLAWMSETKGEL